MSPAAAREKSAAAGALPCPARLAAHHERRARSGVTRAPEPAAAQILRGVHQAFLVLGVGTLASTAIFRGLRPTDGSAVSQHRGDLSEAP